MNSDDFNPNQLVGRWLTRFDRPKNILYTFYIMEYTGKARNFFIYKAFYIVSNMVGALYFVDCDVEHLLTTNTLEADESLWTLLSL